MITVEVDDGQTNVPKVSRNNINISDKSYGTPHIYLILCQSVCGLNRLYLLYNSKLLTWMNNAYSYAVVFYRLFMIYYCLDKPWKAGPKVIGVLIFLSNIIMIVMSTLLRKRKFVKLFQNLTSYDEILGLRSHEIDKHKYFWLWIVACLAIELYSVQTAIDLGALPNDIFIIVANLMTGLSVEIEILFYISLIRMISVRISILKGHVVKKYKLDDVENLTKMERLCYNTDLDIDTLYSVYNLIYKCSQQLNSAITAPMAVLLCVLVLFNVLNTVTVYRVTYVLYISYITTKLYIPTIVMNVSFITLYATLLFGVCYFSTITSKHTATIRQILHETIDTKQLGNHESHKLKSLYRMSQESDIKFTAAEVVTMDMSLIPSYYNVCINYTIIFMQFSLLMWNTGIFPLL